MDNHAGFQPGDVVRDRRTAKDYLIEAVVGGAVAGVTLYKLVGVLDDRIQEVWSQGDEQFRDEFLTVARNTRHVDPNLVLSQLREDFTNIVGQDTILRAHMNRDENTVLRDMVYVSRESDEESFSQGIVELTRALVQGGSRPNKAQVSQLLRDTAGENVSEEFIADLTERINNMMVSASIQSGNRRLMGPGEYQDLLQFTRNEFSLAREAGLFSTRRAAEDLPRLSRLEEKTIGRIFGDREFGTINFGWPELDQTENGMERALVVYRELFKELRGKPMSQKLQSMIRADFNYSRKMASLGRATPHTQLLLKYMKVDEAKRLTDFVPTSQVQNIGRAAVVEARAAASGRGPYGYLGNVVSRTTGIRRPRTGQYFRPAVNWEYVAKSQQMHIPGTRRNQIKAMLSVDMETFMDELVGRNPFTMVGSQNAPIYKLTEKRQYRALAEALGAGAHNTGSVLMDRNQLRRLMEQKAAGEVLDLTDIIHTTGTIQRAMPSDIREQIKRAHYSGNNMLTGERVAEVYLNTKEVNAVMSGSRKKLGTTESELFGHMLADPGEGQFRLWMVHHKSGETYGSNKLDEVLKHMETNANDIEPSGLHVADVGKFYAELQQLTDVPRNKPVLFPDQHYNLLSIEGIRAAAENQGGNIGLESKNFTRAEVKSLAHSSMVNQKSQIADKVQRQKIAIALIKNPQEEQETKIIATNLSTSIERQTELVRRLYDEGGLIVDIETRKQLDGQWLMRELGYAEDHMNGVQHTFELKAGDVTEKKVRAFIDLGKRIKKAAVVGSQTDYDPEHLLGELEVWRRQLADRPELLAQLNEAAAAFNDARESKWLDLTVLHQLRTGETANQVNQEYLALKFLTGKDRIETHQALADVQQAWKLVHQARPNVLANLDHLQLGTNQEQVINSNLFMLETDPRGMRFGRLMQVEDIATPLGGGAVAQIREYIPKLKGGRYTFERGLASYEERADSVHALVGMLGRKGVATSPSTFHQVADRWENALAEQADRELRDLFNVADLRPFPKYEKYTAAIAKDLGPHSMVQFRARVEAKSRMNSAWEMAQSLQEEYTTGLAASTAVIRKPRVQDFLSEAVDRVLGNLDPLGNTDEGKKYYQNMVREEILEMSRRPHYAEMFTNRTSLGRFMESPVGQDLTNSLYQVGKEPFRPMFQAMHAMEMAMDKLGEDIPIKLYGHRLGGEVAGAHISFKLGDMQAGDIQRASSEFQSWGADLLLHLDHGRDQLEAHKFFSRLLGEEQTAVLKTAVKTVRESRGIDHYNVDSWKAALIDISGLPQSPEENLVREAMHELQTSPHGLQQAFSKLITDRQTKLVAAGQTAAQLERGQQLSEYGSKLLGHLESARAAGYTHIEDIFKLALTEYRDKEGTQALDFLQDWGPDQAHLLHLISQFTPEDAQEIHSRTSGLLETLGDKIAQDDTMDLVVSETKSLRGIDRTKAMLQLARGEQKTEVLEAATQASMGRQIMAPPAGARLESEVLHEYVNRAKSAYQNAEGVRPEWETLHELVLRGQPAKMLGALPGPLLAAGGILALMAASRPSDDQFSQGKQQDGMSFFQPYATKYAEIPGQNRVQKSWSGTPDAWQLDITFQGFVAGKREQEELVRTVYDAMEGQVSVRKNHTQVNDERDTNHRQASRNLLRRSL